MAVQAEDIKQAQLLYSSPELTQCIHLFTAFSKKWAQEHLAALSGEGDRDYHQQSIKKASTGGRSW